ncbi:hypothetical protein F6X40_10340 [Paraburkholderia sp. UCT31]|uniref:hypothetical protein n=1 Tax=Paraburkholderia sp. UCT31 TaxID=2615209 RepID=UPI001656732A|nr:hypothetical protein [Paraburkholderia sp. UCT31]MBC8737206.1 hypothetical protein [Paraburkholderia sp. UCT31]
MENITSPSSDSTQQEAIHRAVLAVLHLTLGRTALTEDVARRVTAAAAAALEPTPETQTETSLAHPLRELRLSMTGYSLRIGRDDELRIIAEAPKSAMNAESAFKQWLDDAEHIIAACKAYAPPPAH